MSTNMSGLLCEGMMIWEAFQFTNNYFVYLSTGEDLFS